MEHSFTKITVTEVQADLLVRQEYNTAQPPSSTSSYSRDSKGQNRDSKDRTRTARTELSVTQGRPGRAGAQGRMSTLELEERLPGEYSRRQH